MLHHKAVWPLVMAYTSAANSEPIDSADEDK